MTDAQLKRIYFPTWRAACDATWTWSRGRLALRPEAVPSDARDMVTAHAGTFAAAAVRALRPDDLRHAANALTLQRVRTWRAGTGQPLPATPEAASSKQMDGLALDLFRALCRLIVEPDWLGTDTQPGLLWWENPDQAERRRLLTVLDARTVPGYAASICHSIHGTRDYHTLDYRAVANLYRTIRDRTHAWHPGSVGRSRYAYAHGTSD